MLPRERVVTALRRQVPDRVPFFIRLTPPMLDEMACRTGRRDPEAYFDTDVRDVRILPSQSPADFARYLVGKPAGTYVDDLGGGRLAGQYLHYQHYIPLLEGATTVAEFEAFPLPDIDASYRFAGYPERVQALHVQGYAVRGWLGSLFEWSWHVRGFEELLVDFAARPALAECLLDLRTDLLCRAARCYAAAGVDVLAIHDDIAMQSGPMMSVPMWTRWLQPRLAAIIAAAREAQPGVLVFYHTDGAAAPFVPGLIDAGVDILNPVQPECMDGMSVKQAFGACLAFWGGIGTQTVMPFGTPDDVRRTVRNLAATLGEGGGLLLEPTHVLQPDVPWENVLAFVEAARASRYGC